MSTLARENPIIFLRGPDFLLHHILDFLISNYNPTMDKIEERLDSIEDSVLENPTPKILDSILSLKRNIINCCTSA